MKTKNILFVMFAILAVALPCFAQGMDNIFWRAGLSDHDVPEIKAIINTIDLFH